MKLYIALSALVAVALCAPYHYENDPEMEKVIARRQLPALEHEEVHDQYGQFALRYVTAEGTVVSERGHLVPTGRGGYVLVTEGEVSYIGDDGQLYITKWSAGIDGYHSETNHPLVAPEPVQG
ncbi:unnamed protein product [Colias eurytheme]|nr:unnamed protein product [Colias eurytheme]CAG4937558.1 unnamed protein product [Colias eurytheme]CAG4937566.1 unnamed protein product [Colias eurytheme]CAG4937570.1 unnamed protein product [Colias eurytheme]